MKTLCSYSIVICFLIIISSCGKYPEGPGVSLKSSQARVSGEWSIEKAWKNGNPVEVINENLQIGEITEDVILYEDNACLKEGGTHPEYKGTWELTDNNTIVKICLTIAGNSNTQEYKIIKLTNHQMVWEHNIGSDLYRIEMNCSNPKPGNGKDEI